MESLGVEGLDSLGVGSGAFSPSLLSLLSSDGGSLSPDVGLPFPPFPLSPSPPFPLPPSPPLDGGVGSVSSLSSVGPGTIGFLLFWWLRTRGGVVEMISSSLPIYFKQSASPLQIPNALHTSLSPGFTCCLQPSQIPPTVTAPVIDNRNRRHIKIIHSCIY